MGVEKIRLPREAFRQADVVAVHNGQVAPTRQRTAPVQRAGMPQVALVAHIADARVSEAVNDLR
jgi:hypothetical protein